MKYNTQTDQRWAKEIMTQCNEKYRKWIDYIWRWGCLVTSIANIVQEHFNKPFTPKNMNDLIIQNKCYNYLSNPDCSINIASFLLLDKLQSVINATIINNLHFSKYTEKKNVYWIARIIHRTGGGHYINVIRKDANMWECFDVENGKIKSLKDKDITKLIKLEF